MTNALLPSPKTRSTQRARPSPATVSPTYRVASPDLFARPIRLRDIPAALAVSQEGKQVSPAERASTCEALGDLLKQRRMFGVVVLDNRRPPQKQVVGIGTGGFLTDDFQSALWGQQADSYLLRRILRSPKEHSSPLSDFEETFTNNTPEKGLNFTGLLFGDLGEQLSAERAGQVRDRLFEAMLQSLRGYYLRTWTKEVYGDENFQKFQNIFGAKLVRAHELPDRTEHQQPFLMGLTREEALAPEREGRPVRYAFAWHSPKIGFTKAERKVLQMASRYRTHETIARHLDIAASTVRSQMDSALRRAELSAEFGDLSRTVEGGYLRQCQERSDKWATLLDYLASHPEELRPHWHSLTDLQ